MDPDLQATIDTYDAIAAKYESRHVDRTAIAALLERFLDNCDGNRILDVGCGPGWETETFDRRGYDVIGIDLSKSFLASANDRVPGHVARMDMRTPGLSNGSFDGIWACASFLHVPRGDARKTLEAFGRLLDTGTIALAVKLGEGKTVGDTYENDQRVFTRYTEPELCSLLEGASISITNCTTHDGEWLQCIGSV
ncbi:class I SAM-dependent methyltransferase [Halocatena halophila]|uniref:class I SAM-dependent methyltransferase n=1 Tax=Halocatena halophila TaxID=2814576 RepID=UPI002ED0C2B4